MHRPVVLEAEVGDFFGVGGDDDAVELGAGGGGFVDPGEHRPSGDDAEDFTGETGGGEAGGDDTENGGGSLFAGLRVRLGIRLGIRLGMKLRIKYDGSWLCRGDVSLSAREFCAGVTPLHTSAV
jgi:hypothetical protein